LFRGLEPPTAGDEGPITTTAARSGADAEISIADQALGLPKEELEEVFAPFYRPESARTRVEACGGTVACRNRVPRGLEVTIRLQAG
jgi:two-component system sensor histidine kinase CpxA